MNDLWVILDVLLRLLFILAIILAVVGLRIWRDHRAQRAAERRQAPIRQWERTLNETVVTYVRGVHDGAWPAGRPEVLVAAYGPHLEEAARSLAELLAEADAVPDWSQDPDDVAARRIKITMGRRHPELDDVAIDGLVAHAMFQRRRPGASSPSTATGR